MSDALSTHAETVHVPAAQYARLVHTLRGDVPTIHTVAILTAVLSDYHLDKSEVTQHNIWRNSDLLHDLATHSTHQIKGRFGSLENPYAVANLPRARLVELGVKYGQDAVIFGYHKGGARLGMGFEQICTDAATGTVGHAVATRRMLMTARTSDTGEEHLNKGDGGAVFSVRYKGGTFEIPFFDEDAAREDDFRGSRVLTYRSADIPAHVKPALEAYLAAETELAEALREGNRTGHYLHVHRGVLGNARVALFQAMGDWKPFPFVGGRTW